MVTYEDRALAVLQQRFPDKQIWYVPRYMETAAWCAREPLVNADSPEELAELLGAAPGTVSFPS